MSIVLTLNQKAKVSSQHALSDVSTVYEPIINFEPITSCQITTTMPKTMKRVKKNIETQTIHNVTVQEAKMSTQKPNTNENLSTKMNSKQIKLKTQEFLSSRKKLQPFNDLIKEFEVRRNNFYKNYRFFHESF